MARPPDDVAARHAGGVSHGFPWRVAGVAIVATLALGGSSLLGVGLNTAADPPPQPVAGAVGPEASPEAPPVGGGAPPPTGAGAAPVGLPRSEPIGIRIPKIGVDAKTLPLGLDNEGMVQVPPLEQAQHAGWFKLGPSPGEVGPAVIVGHVDSSKTGPAVFFQLGVLLPGDAITVNRKDGSIATFIVDAVTSFPKTAFPTDLVYANTASPSLRVVTCGGKFDKKARSYPNNVIVFATLVSPAPL